MQQNSLVLSVEFNEVLQPRQQLERFCDSPLSPFSFLLSLGSQQSVIISLMVFCF